MYQIALTLKQLLLTLGTLVGELLGVFFYAALAIFWIMWATCALDWRKLWPLLREGAAVPLVMVAAAVAAVSGGVAPSDLSLFGDAVRVPNFVWQIGAAGLFLGVTLFCGWLQVRCGWFPQEVPVAPLPSDRPAIHGHAELDAHAHEEPHADGHGH